jgi:hypothetical protein
MPDREAAHYKIITDSGGKAKPYAVKEEFVHQGE